MANILVAKKILKNSNYIHYSNTFNTAQYFSSTWRGQSGKPLKRSFIVPINIFNNNDKKKYIL